MKLLKIEKQKLREVANEVREKILKNRGLDDSTCITYEDVSNFITNMENVCFEIISKRSRSSYVQFFNNEQNKIKVVVYFDGDINNVQDAQELLIEISTAIAIIFIKDFKLMARQKNDGVIYYNYLYTDDKMKFKYFLSELLLPKKMCIKAYRKIVEESNTIDGFMVCNKISDKFGVPNYFVFRRLKELKLIDN